MFISSNPKDSLSKIAHFRLSMVSVPDVGLIHLTRNDRLPTAFVPGVARRRGSGSLAMRVGHGKSLNSDSTGLPSDIRVRAIGFPT
jgi:hypothetical protein